MSSSASYTNFSQFPPDAEIHHLRGENASLKMANQKLISTSAVLYQEIEDAKVIIGQKEEEIAQKDKKLEERDGALKKMKTQLDDKDKELSDRALKLTDEVDKRKESEVAVKSLRGWLHWERKRLEQAEACVKKHKNELEIQAAALLKADSEIAQLKAENLKLKTEKTICKQMGVDIDLLSSSGTPASPAAINSAPIVGSEEDENEGPWAFFLPDEHKLPTPTDAPPDFDPTFAAVIRFGDKHYVVPMSWYDDADVEDLDNEEELLKVFIGIVNNPVYPDENGEELTGTFVPKE